MSMINDALKRARVNQPKSLTADGLNLRAVDEPRRNKGGIDLLMIGLIAVILLLSALLAYAWYSSPSEIKVRARTADVPIAPPTAPTPVALQPVPVAAPVKAPTPVANAVTNLPVPVIAEVPDKVTVAAVEPPKPAPAVYKLQGIFYRGKHSSAVINGKSAFVGERVNGAKVLAINGESVVIETESGDRKMLDLP